MAKQPRRTTNTTHPTGGPHRGRTPTGPTSPTIAQHQPATAPGTTSPPGPTRSAGPAVADQPRRTPRTPGRPGITATTPTTPTTEQQPTITTTLTHRTTSPISTITNQRPPHQHLSRRVDRIKHQLTDIDRLGSRIHPPTHSQRPSELVMKPRHPPRQHLIIAPMLRKQPRDRRRHLILRSTSQPRRSPRRRRTGRTNRRPQRRQIRRRRSQHLRRHEHKRHGHPPVDTARPGPCRPDPCSPNPRQRRRDLMTLADSAQGYCTHLGSQQLHSTPPGPANVEHHNPNRAYLVAADIRARARDSIDAHLTVVFAAMEYREIRAYSSPLPRSTDQSRPPDPHRRRPATRRSRRSTREDQQPRCALKDAITTPAARRCRWRRCCRRCRGCCRNQ